MPPEHPSTDPVFTALQALAQRAATEAERLGWMRLPPPRDLGAEIAFQSILFGANRSTLMSWPEWGAVEQAAANDGRVNRHLHEGFPGLYGTATLNLVHVVDEFLWGLFRRAGFRYDEACFSRGHAEWSAFFTSDHVPLLARAILFGTEGPPGESSIPGDTVLRTVPERDALDILFELTGGGPDSHHVASVIRNPTAVLERRYTVDKWSHTHCTNSLLDDAAHWFEVIGDALRLLRPGRLLMPVVELRPDRWCPGAVRLWRGTPPNHISPFRSNYQIEHPESQQLAALVDAVEKERKRKSHLDTVVLHGFSRSTQEDSAIDRLVYAVIAMEAFFLTDGQSELSHRLAERVAVFLGVTPMERVSLYGFVKHVYTQRSKLVHGVPLAKLDGKGLDGRPARFGDMVDQFETVLRRTLNKALAEDNDQSWYLNPKGRWEWLLFGHRTP